MINKQTNFQRQDCSRIVRKSAKSTLRTMQDGGNAPWIAHFRRSSFFEEEDARLENVPLNCDTRGIRDGKARGTNRTESALADFLEYLPKIR